MTSDSEGGRGFGKSDAYWRGGGGGGFGVNWRQIFFTDLTSLGGGGLENLTLSDGGGGGGLETPNFDWRHMWTLP